MQMYLAKTVSAFRIGQWTRQDSSLIDHDCPRQVCLCMCVCVCVHAITTELLQSQVKVKVNPLCVVVGRVCTPATPPRPHTTLEVPEEGLGLCTSLLGMVVRGRGRW